MTVEELQVSNQELDNKNQNLVFGLIGLVVIATILIGYNIEEEKAGGRK